MATAQALSMTGIISHYSDVVTVVVLFKVLLIGLIVCSWLRRRQKIRQMLAGQERLRDRLQKEQERTRILIAQSSDWLFQCNAEYELTACSPTFQRTFGGIGGNDNDDGDDVCNGRLLPLHPDDTAMFRLLCAKAQEVHCPVFGSLRFSHPNGEWQAYELKLITVGNPGPLQDYLGYVRPVQG